MEVTGGDRHVALPHKEWHHALKNEPNFLTDFFISGSVIEVQNS